MAISRIVAAGRFLSNVIETEQLAIVLVDPDGSQHAVLPDTAAQPDGFLAVFLVAAEAVWEDATGTGFGITISEDTSALLGFRADDMANVPFSWVAPTILYAIDRARDGDVLRLNALAMHAAQDRLRARQAAPAPEASPAPASGPHP